MATSDDAGADASVPATSDDGSVDVPDAAADGAMIARDAAQDAPDDALVPAIATCAPKGSACASLPPVPAIFAAYRKDRALPDSAYAEQGAAPAAGGRFHIATVAAVSGDVTGLQIGGRDAETLLAEPHLEWYHVWPRKAVAGEPIWISFHSRDAAWDGTQTGSVAVQTSGGLAVNGTFPVAPSPVVLTSVTTTADRLTLLVHVANTDASPHALSRLVVNGRDVTTPDVACIPKSALGPGESALFTVPLCAAAEIGSAWTVVAETSGAPPAVGVGRVMPPHFPLEAWTTGSDCAFPGANAQTYAQHQAAGLDTHYMYFGNNAGCGFTGSDIVNRVAPKEKDFHVLVGDDFLSLPNPETAIHDTSRVVGFLLGDEVDGIVYDKGAPKPMTLARQALRLWQMYPGLPVYQGGKTNKNVGAFAGATDVQGMDFYVAACAPHITQFGTHPPLRGAYDYLRNAHDNHMPLPTWLYSQGLHAGWNKNTLGLVHVQPAPQEILVQAMSVLAAGGKGLMWFQTDLSEASHAPERWAALASATWTARGVRELLREGAPTGLATSDGEAIVEAIRSRDALVVPVIALRTTAAPTDISCAASILSESQVPHWVLAAQSLKVRVTIPDDLAIRDVFEVRGKTVVDPSEAIRLDARTIELGGVAVDQTQPTRLFVFARTKDVRANVTALLSTAPRTP